MKPQIIPFEPEHLTAFEWRYSDDPAGDVGWMAELIDQYQFAGRTGCIGDKIIGIGGVLLLGCNQGYALVSFSREVEPHKVWFHRVVRRGFLEIIREHALKYVWSWLPENDVRYRGDWLEALGFSDTGEREHGKDGRLYARYAVGVL